MLSGVIIYGVLRNGLIDVLYEYEKIISEIDDDSARALDQFFGILKKFNRQPIQDSLRVQI